ncbi:hypothetical protein OIV83_001374 [Microbotryomycetes sp. JL201]|nr:hypothetical protein OIV83_001374 [Microbotryomycetes sp. JL201]
MSAPVPVTPGAHNSGTGARPTGMPDDLTKLPFPSVLYRPAAVIDEAVCAPAAASPFVVGSSTVIARGMSSSEPRRGTTADPVIPKRRRRTTAGEQAVLESAFQRNPRPDAHERAQLAQQLPGMTPRAVAVWMQNRRQKEKKEQSSFRGSSAAPSSAGSSPEMDSGEFDELRSSSPSSRSTAAPPSSASIENATRLALQASEIVYKALPDNKENVRDQADLVGDVKTAHVTIGGRATLPSVLCPVVGPVALPALQAYGVDMSSGTEAKMTHRSATTSVIAAKKHVRRRPLGSHAPLARKPSLSHAFNFPPSPPKSKSNSSKTTVDRPEIRRQGSSASLASLQRAIRGSIFDQPDSSTENDTLNRARSWVDALSSRALGEGFEETETSSTQPPVEAEERETTRADHTRAEPAPTPVTKRLRARDELLQHMASDLPSSPASPAAIRPGDDLARHSGSTRAAHRPPTRGVRLGFSESATTAARQKRTTASMTATIEGSRAGGEATDALSALERKRARIVGHEELSVANGPAMTTRPKQARRTSSQSSTHSRSRGKKQSASITSNVAAAGSKAGYSATMLIDAAAQELGRQRQASLTSAASADAGHGGPGSGVSLADHDSDMGDLSFSSTSTDNSVVIGTPKHESTGFSLRRHSAKVGEVNGKVVDGVVRVRESDETERECAELLLGLGGFH